MNRPAKLATATAALALATATTVAAPAAQATPAPAGNVVYVAQASGSAAGGSLDNQLVQAGLLVIAGVGVSALLAIGAGVAGGAFPLPPIPGL